MMDDDEEKQRLISQVLELQNTLDGQSQISVYTGLGRHTTHTHRTLWTVSHKYQFILV